MVNFSKKLIITLLLIFSLFVNSFAAIISDNDGSAFVTKAEFDALKNSFKEQIESYNSSIDGKIDGAIAAYLAGIRVVDWQNEKIIMSNWKDVTCFNGTVQPTYQLPDTNITYTINHFQQTSDAGIADYSNNLFKVMIMSWKGKYKKYAWNALRPLVTGNVENGDQSKNMVWNGIALGYNETYKIIRSYHHFGNTPNLAYLDQVDKYNYGGAFQDGTSIALNGYYSDFDELKDEVVNPTIQWWWQPISGGARSTSTLNYVGLEFGIVNTAEISLKEVLGKTKEYEHIIQWDKDDKWCVSNETFTKTFRPNTANTLKSSNLLSSVDQEQKMDFFGMQTNPAFPTIRANLNKAISLTMFQCSAKSGTLDITDTSASILPSIGMLKEDQKAEDIKQFEKEMDVTVGKNTYKVPANTLEEGFPLLAANKGDTIKWSPVFSEVETYKDATHTQKNANEINMKFSLGSFKNKDEIKATSSVIKVKNSTQPAEEEVVKTSSRRADLTFKMPDSGIVYVKWWPEMSDETLFNMGWYTILNLNSCSDYSYMKEE